MDNTIFIGTNTVRPYINDLKHGLILTI